MRREENKSQMSCFKNAYSSITFSMLSYVGIQHSAVLCATPSSDDVVFFRGELPVSLGFLPSCWHPFCKFWCVFSSSGNHLAMATWPPRSWEAKWFQWREDVLFRNSLEVTGCERCWQHMMRPVCALIHSQWRRTNYFWIRWVQGLGHSEGRLWRGGTVGLFEIWGLLRDGCVLSQGNSGCNGKKPETPQEMPPYEASSQYFSSLFRHNLIFWALFDFSAIIDLGPTLRMGRFIQNICQTPGWQQIVSTFWVCEGLSLS